MMRVTVILCLTALCLGNPRQQGPPLTWAPSPNVLGKIEDIEKAIQLNSTGSEAQAYEYDYDAEPAESAVESFRGSLSHVTESLTNRRGEQLAAHYWYPPSDVTIRGLIFLSHGFSEHLGLYHEVGQYLSERGFLAFGHDHVGHGSSEGESVYIETVGHYVDDVVDHSLLMQEKHPEVPLFLVGHGMGGMVGLRAIIRHPTIFQGLIHIGILIIPGSQVGPLHLGPKPWVTFVSKAVPFTFIQQYPEVPVASSTQQYPVEREAMVAMVNWLEEHL